MQEMIVGLVVLGAVAYLVNTMRQSTKGGGCGCSNKICSKNAAPKNAAPKAADSLIQISLDKRP